jgi:LysM repeat protein
VTLFTPSAGSAITGAISATAVLSASGLLATPAHSAEASNQVAESPVSLDAQVTLSQGAIERALAPAAAPVVISAAPAALAAPQTATAKHDTHRVERGDTVWDLARHYGTTVTAIIDANGLDSKATIRVGDTLVIPAPASTGKAPTQRARTATATHVVRNGDTVWDLAQRYDTTTHAIISANSLGSDAVIRVGDKLTIPGAKASSKASAPTASGTKKSTGAASRYTVKAGDTLGAIAKRFGSSVAAIASANRIADPSLIRVGQVLSIPGGVPTGLVGDTFAGRTYPKDVVSAANVNKQILNESSVPTRAQMRALIVKTAKQQGVDVSLALAIAYQESGFNQRAVSPANAVGVMQVIPSTGEWISTMVGRDLDLLDPHDNVTAGVVLLRYLTRNADSLDQAIAGYYQGLSGVRKYGMNTDTKQYVKSVRALMKKFD